MRVRWVLGVVPLAVVLGCSSATAPASAQDVQVDGARMMRVVGALAHDSMQGRQVGTPGGERARRFIVHELGARGVPPLGDYEHPFDFTSGILQRHGVNVLGIIRGTRTPDRYIVVTAHYDHVGVRNGVIYNGADDNASGVTALLELASWFSAHRPEHSIIIAALDAEEAGLQGAKAFLSEAPVPLSAIVANINMDMVGRNADSEVYAVGTRYYPQLKKYVDEAAKHASVTIRFGHDGSVSGEQDWTSASDHGPFHARGIPFLYFGVEDHADYHQPTDDVERLMPAFFAGVARAVIDVTSRIDRGL